jgi:hypothetical protein
MPDGDIFAKTVSRNWVNASRLSFSLGDDAVAIGECEKALTRDLNERPWNGFADAVRDIAEAAMAEGDVADRRRVLKNLEWYREKWPADRYEVMLRVANQILTRESFSEWSLVDIREALETRVAAEILTESIITRVAPACTAARLEQAGKMDISRFHTRTVEIQMLLRDAPGLRSLADQLKRAPKGQYRRVRTPRTQLPRVPQSELVEMPIG